MNFLKKCYMSCYNLAVSYTNSKYALYILILTAFTESSFFLLPPDVLLIPMAFAVPSKALFYAFITTISSVFGGIFGYVLGYYAYDGFLKSTIEFLGYSNKFAEFQSFYNNYGVLAVFIAGFTPIPYKIATIASGIFKANIIPFVVASLCSRGLRFFLLAFIIKFYHTRGKDYIVKNFKQLSILFSIIIILFVFLYIMYQQFR